MWSGLTPQAMINAAFAAEGGPSSGQPIHRPGGVRELPEHEAGLIVSLTAEEPATLVDVLAVLEARLVMGPTVRPERIG
jgi:hypothetical protein